MTPADAPVVRVDWADANLIAQLAASDTELNHYTAGQRNFARAYLAQRDEIEELREQVDQKGYVTLREPAVAILVARSERVEAAEARCKELEKLVIRLNNYVWERCKGDGWNSLTTPDVVVEACLIECGLDAALAGKE